MQSDVEKSKQLTYLS